MIYKSFFKRLIDLVVSLIVLIVLLPVVLIATVLIWISFKEQPFFVQERPGKNLKIFRLIKLKTMNSSKNANGDLLPDQERINKLGVIIRKWSIDETPQLLNVILGDMSLIGPRPLLKEYIPLYNDFQARRHEIRPGITGLAQINGRNQLPWQERFKLDIYYVDNISLFLDLKILLITIKNVMLRKNISGRNSITMEKFQGN